MKAETILFAPMFVLLALVVVGWTVTEVNRIRIRGWRLGASYGFEADAPRKLVMPAAPQNPAARASNDEQHRRVA